MYCHTCWISAATKQHCELFLKRIRDINCSEFIAFFSVFMEFECFWSWKDIFFFFFYFSFSVHFVKCCIIFFFSWWRERIKSFVASFHTSYKTLLVFFIYYNMIHSSQLFINATIKQIWGYIWNSHCSWICIYYEDEVLSIEKIRIGWNNRSKIIECCSNLRKLLFLQLNVLCER